MSLSDRLRQLEARLGVGTFAPKVCTTCGKAPREFHLAALDFPGGGERSAVAANPCPSCAALLRESGRPKRLVFHIEPPTSSRAEPEGWR